MRENAQEAICPSRAAVLPFPGVLQGLGQYVIHMQQLPQHDTYRPVRRVLHDRGYGHKEGNQAAKSLSDMWKDIEIVMDLYYLTDNRFKAMRDLIVFLIIEVLMIPLFLLTSDDLGVCLSGMFYVAFLFMASRTDVGKRFLEVAKRSCVNLLNRLLR